MLDSQSLKLIQNIRNEAHRFGIAFHRNRRIKSALISEIDNIPGIGDKTMQKLIEKFGNISLVKEAELEQPFG